MTTGINPQHAHNWEQQREQLSAYLDDELGDTERTALEAHLPTCEQCRHALAELRETRALLRALPAPTLPRAFTLPASGVIPHAIAAQRNASTLAGSAGQRAGSGRLLQWIGGLAAALGLFFLIGSALAGTHGLIATGANTAAGYSPATEHTTPSFAPNTGVHTQGPDAATGQSPIASTPTKTTVVTATPTPNANPLISNNAASAPPLGELAGTALLIGGAGLLVGGTVLSRRRKSA